MYLLCCVDKYDEGRQRVLRACKDEFLLHKLATDLNNYIGYESGMGIWAQDIAGYFFVRKVEVLPADKLDSNFMGILDDFKKGR